MKRDGRTLDHATLETIRTMAVERVREGERPSEVIASYGFHRCTISRWLTAARDRPPTDPDGEAGTTGGPLDPMGRIHGNMGSTSVCGRARLCAN